MTQFEKVKKDIAEMNMHDFIQFFGGGDSNENSLCMQVYGDYEMCHKNPDANCYECIKAFLESEVEI